jgi:BON domain
MDEANDVRDPVEDDLTFAPAVAHRVAGVKTVHSHLKVALPPGDHRDDPALTAPANNALTLNSTAPTGVGATAENGDITLTGTVRDGTERAAAEMLVAGLTGVRSVKNYIQISHGTDRPVSSGTSRIDPGKSGVRSSSAGRSTSAPSQWQASRASSMCRRSWMTGRRGFPQPCGSGTGAAT